jgi:hypothetical protein
MFQDVTHVLWQMTRGLLATCRKVLKPHQQRYFKHSRGSPKLLGYPLETGSYLRICGCFAWKLLLTSYVARGYWTQHTV